MLALIIFALTLFGILLRPFGFRIWVYSSVGAVATLAFKLVDFSDLWFVFRLIWDCAFALIALIVISYALQGLGFFEWLIFWVLKICADSSAQKHKSSTAFSHYEYLTCHTEVAQATEVSHKKSIEIFRLKAQNDNRDISAFSKPQYDNVVAKYSEHFTADSHTNLHINTRKIFIALCVFCAFTSAVLANDGAILIFTPLVLGLFLRARNATPAQIIAFLFATAFMCDISSNALIISNLTNIITANFFHIGFGEFARSMLLPNAFATLGAIALFLAVFRAPLSAQIAFRAPLKPKLSNKLFALHCACLCVFVASFFLSTHFGVPLSVNCGIYAGILLAILWHKSHSKAKSTLKNAPFGIIVFVFGLFVVVFALTKTAILPLFVTFLNAIAHDTFSTIFGTGLASALGASIFNNLPMVLFGNLAINEVFSGAQNLVAQNVEAQSTNLKESFIYAHLLGCNIGSKLTPIGSLCTLLWLSLLANNSTLSQRGIDFGFVRYCKYALIFMPFVLLCACAGLWIIL